MKMTTEKLIKALKICRSVYSCRWNVVCAIVSQIEQKQATISSKEWGIKYKRDNPSWYPLDLSKRDTWSAMENGIDLRFSIFRNRLVCEANIYNCNSFDGERLEERFSVKLLLPNSFIQEIEVPIMRKIERMVEDEYHAEQIKKEKALIKKRMTNLLR
jgi:hypothetical protein